MCKKINYLKKNPPPRPPPEKNAHKISFLTWIDYFDIKNKQNFTNFPHSNHVFFFLNGCGSHFVFNGFIPKVNQIIIPREQPY